MRRRGSLEGVSPAAVERTFDYGQGPSPSLAVSWGDVASAYFSTGVPDITVYFEATAAVRAHGTMARLLDWAVPFTPWQASLNVAAGWLPEGPTDVERSRHRAVIVAEVEGEGGEVRRSRLRTPDSYSFTAVTATAIAGKVLAGDLEPGFQTPPASTARTSCSLSRASPGKIVTDVSSSKRGVLCATIGRRSHDEARPHRGRRHRRWLRGHGRGVRADAPGARGKYRVTVYQLGWRLGGKGASGSGAYDRIEEHGLHLWMGFYENAFRLMRECYAGARARPGECRLADWRDAFEPDHFNAVADRSPRGDWLPWTVQFPPLPGLPGDPERRPPALDRRRLPRAARSCSLRTLLDAIQVRAGTRLARPRDRSAIRPSLRGSVWKGLRAVASLRPDSPRCGAPARRSDSWRLALRRVPQFTRRTC